MGEGVGTKQEDVRVSVLALMPSIGLGGGIEAYFAALREALCELGAHVETVALQTRERQAPTVSAKAHFVLTAVATARRLAKEEDPLVLVLHPGLLPVGALAQLVARARSPRCALFFYGADISGHSALSRRLANRAGWRIVTVSSFSAGALAACGPVTVLPPGIPQERYERLVTDAPLDERPARDIDVLTVFRLAHAEVKGAFELLQAGDIVRRGHSDFSLVIAGSGRAPAHLRDAVRARSSWVDLREDVPFDDLADLYRRAKIFVLATRSHVPGQKGFRGEGFGIVLAEAQLAGAPVIAPALGGSSDAFVDGLTGLRAPNDSPEAFAATIDRLLVDDALLKSTGEYASEWAKEKFSASTYEQRVKAGLLDEP